MEKHVLILTTNHDFLGKFELDNVAILQQMGYTVHYAANMKEPHYLSERKRIQALGVCTHHIDIARSPFLWKENQKALCQIMQIIEAHQIRMLHCHTPVGGVLGRLAGHFFRKWQVSVIYTAHGFHFYKGAPLQNRVIYYQVEKYLARYTDVLIVINEEDYRNALRLRLKKGGRVYRIPGAGLDLERFRIPDEKERRSYREAFGIAEQEFFLVSVGELNGNKNHQAVLEALALLRRENRLDGIVYGICGDGVLREQLEAKISELGLTGAVRLFGHRKDVPKILGGADASVFPSRREGLGMAGLESLAMGVPVIASDNRGTREYMEHGKNGYVCAYDDAAGFAEGICTLRRILPEYRKEMAKHCADAAKPFDRRYTMAVMRRIYEGAEYGYQENSESQCFDGRLQSG